jgi:hypothetical protein
MSKALQIGRADTNDIIISDLSVSRQHGVLTFGDFDSFTYEDLNSANGSFINGNRVYGKVILKKTDILKVGKSLVPWQNYITQQNSYTSNKEHNSHEKEAPPVFNNSPLDNQSNTKKNKIVQYWPVLVAFFVIGIIILIVQGKSNKKHEDTEVVLDHTENDDSNNNEKVVKVSDINLEEINSDSDNDGIKDNKDDCPKEKGPKSNNGCPFYDSDEDGTLDKDDDCKFDYGPRWNDGCPDEYYPETYRTQCPNCNNITFETSVNTWWNCGCGERFYNCYKISASEYDGIPANWVGDGTCDCSGCYDE